MKHLLEIFLFAFIFCSLVSCGNIERQDIDSTQTEKTVVQVSSTEESVVDPFEEYPYRTLGLTVNEVDLNDSLVHLAELEADACTEEGNVTLNQILYYDSQQITFEYSVSDTGDVEEKHQYLAVYNTDTCEFTEQIEIASVSEDESCWVELVHDSISVAHYRDGNSEYQLYTASLQLIDEFCYDYSCYGCFDCDLNFYHINNRTLYCRSKNAEEAVSFSWGFAPESVSGIFYNDAGERCALMSGYASDLWEYESVIANLDTDELLYAGNDLQDGYFTVDDNACVFSSLAGDNREYISIGSNSAISYSMTSDKAVNFDVLPNGLLLFYWTAMEEEQALFHISLFDMADGEFIAECSFANGSSWPWIFGNAVPVNGKGELFFCISGDDGELDFYIWDYGREVLTSSDMIQVSCLDDTGYQLQKIDYIRDPAEFLPSPCPSELEILRLQANEMEDEYGLKIKIGPECKNLVGGYAVEACSDYTTIEEALYILDEELAKYPEGFLKQLSVIPNLQLEIDLTGTLTGTNSLVISTASGFQTITNESILIAFDINYMYMLNETIHHEISHVIDICMECIDETYFSRFEELWNSLNPDMNCYTENYDQFGDGNHTQYVWNGENPTDAYFIDDYSMTYQTEDRARLFEYIMTGSTDVDWTSCIHLRAKLNAYAEQIRNSFDSESWNNVPWECWMD